MCNENNKSLLSSLKLIQTSLSMLILGVSLNRENIAENKFKNVKNNNL